MTETTLKYYAEGRPLFAELATKKIDGKVFTRNDLTKDILYTLAIEENATDDMIGMIFDLSINQVHYLRIKYGLQNKFLKRSIDHPECTLAFLEEQGYDTSAFSKEQLLNMVYSGCKEYVKSKKWNMDNFNRCLMEKLGESAADDLINLSDFEFEYSVIYTNKNYQGHKKITNRKTSGSNINQENVSKSKRMAGKIGEKIVYDSEIKRLKNSNLEELADKVIWASKTEDKNITFGGTGYDIISYNEKKEKIYIEVKCATTNHTDDVIFDISRKEVSFMNGELKDRDNNPIDKDHCFIYYVSNINQKLQLAEIFIIDHKIFSTYQLTPTHYRVQECYTNQ